MKRNEMVMKLMKRAFFLNLCVVLIAVAGCAPLKKKFTRKKKEQKESKFIPVLEPVDYTAKIYAPSSSYKQAYSLWMVWQKDLLQQIQRDGSTKNQEFLISKGIDQLVKMKDNLAEKKREGLEKIISSYRGIKKEYDKPDAFRDKGSMIRKIESAGKKVRLQYSPDVLDENSYLSGSKEMVE